MLSTDAVVHDLYATDEVTRTVVERFGDAVAPDGTVNRAALAERAFASSEGRIWLEEMLWPLVAARMAAWREQAALLDPPPPAIVVEVPLLFEAGMQDGFDATIAIVAPERQRRERAAARGHRALQQRGERQLTQEEKAARATYVVINDGDKHALSMKLSAILDMLCG